MHTLLENIDRHRRTWLLQNIVDTLALSLDMPLQLISIQAAGNLYDLCISQYADEVAHMSPGKEEFSAFLAQLANGKIDTVRYFFVNQAKWQRPMSALSDAIQATRPSYSGPLFTILRRTCGWKWWECCLHSSNIDHMLRNSLLEGDRAEPRKYTFGDVSFFYIYIKSPIPGTVVVAGPIFAPPENGKVNSISTLISETIAVMTATKYQPLFDPERLSRLAEVRTFGSIFDVAERLGKAWQALRILLITKVGERRLSQEDLISITEWSIFLANATKQQGYWSDSPDGARLCNGEINLYYPMFDAFKSGINPYVDRNPQVIAAAKISTNSGNVTQVSSTILEHRAVRVAKNIDGMTGRLYADEQSLKQMPSHYAHPLVPLDITLSRTLDDIHTQRHSHFLEHFLIVRTDLNDQFGLFTRARQHKREEQELGSIHDPRIDFSAARLAQHVASILNADICAMYRYNHSTQVLNVLGHYHSQNDEEWLSLHQQKMAAVANYAERYESICYRAIDSDTQRVCYEFDPVTKVAYPENEILLIPGDRNDVLEAMPKSGRSAIATPLTVFGKPWGILELIGLYPGQFAAFNHAIVAELAGVIAPIFYNQFMIESLRRLNQIFSLSKSIEEKFASVCVETSELLLCAGASIWMSDPSRPENLVCLGLYTHSINDGHISRRISNERLIARVQKDSFGAFLESGAKWIQSSLDYDGLHSQELKSRLKAGGIGSVCTIKIPKQTERGRYGVIFLYNRNSQIYDDRWEEIFAFYGKHLSILASALLIQEGWERRGRNIIGHEIKLHANLMSSLIDSACRLVKLSLARSRSFNSNDNRHILTEEDARKLEHILHDSYHAKNNLDSTLAFLTSDALREVMWSEEEPAVTMAEIYMRQRPLEELNLRRQMSQVMRLSSKPRHIRSSAIGVSHYLPRILMHKANLMTILHNIFSNAFKYSASGTEVLISAVLKPGGIELNISNRGLRLKSGEKNRLFTMNFRGEEARSRDIEGTGRGLFIARSVARLYGINIRHQERILHDNDVYSDHIFTITIPKRLLKEV